MKRTETSRLQRHVYRLAEEIGERNVFRPEALRAAEEYVKQIWHQQGYEVVEQKYSVQGVRSTNLEVTRLGKVRPDEIILLGAHYDSVVGAPRCQRQR